MKTKILGSIIGLMVIFGCGGSGSPYVPDTGNNNNTSFGIGSATSTFTVVQGELATIPLSVFITQNNQTRNSSPVNLSVEGLPNDSTATFSANPVTPTDAGTAVNLSVQTSNNAEDRAQVLNRTTPGSYNLTITGNNGTSTRTHTVQLIVQSANQNFSISVETLDGQMTNGPEQGDARNLIPDDINARYRVSIDAPESYRGMVRLEYRFTQTGAPSLADVIGNWYKGLEQSGETIVYNVTADNLRDSVELELVRQRFYIPAGNFLIEVRVIPDDNNFGGAVSVVNVNVIDNRNQQGRK